MSSIPVDIQHVDTPLDTSTHSVRPEVVELTLVFLFILLGLRLLYYYYRHPDTYLPAITKALLIETPDLSDVSDGSDSEDYGNHAAELAQRRFFKAKRR